MGKMNADTAGGSSNGLNGQRPFVLRRRAMHQSSHSTPLSDELGSTGSTKNVIVLGGSYGGMHAATVLAQRLPPSHRVILIERNSHFNHLYVFPRFSTLPGHEHKAFIPYSAIFKDAPKRPSKRRIATDHQKPDEPEGQASGAAAPNGKASRPKKESSMSLPPPAKQRPGSGSSDDSRPEFRLQRQADADRRSDSRSPSGTGDSQYDKDSLPSTNTPGTSLSASDGEDMQERQKELNKKSTMAAHDASNQAVEQAIMAESHMGVAREEEGLGRPEMVVEKLEDALQKGIDLQEGEAEASNEQVASGFEDSSPHVVLQATVTSITPTHVVVQSNEAAVSTEKKGSGKKLWSIDSVSIPYSHLIYALGSHLPDPLRTEARTKEAGMSWMRDIQTRVRGSQEIVLVGGGALGVQFATDIKTVHPEKKVTLIHSRKQLLPNFDEKLHEVALERLLALKVDVVLGERLALTEGCPRGSSVTKEERHDVQHQPAICTPGDAKGEGWQAHREGICAGDGRKRVKTTGGKEFECDLLLLCTGQQPNSSLLAQLSPTSVDSRTRLIRVLRTLQVQVPTGQNGMAPMPFDPTPPCGDCDCFLDKKAEGADGKEEDESAISGQGCLSNVYAIGDVADAFGALNAGYQAWNMADVAAGNIIRDIEADAQDVSETQRHAQLQHFQPVGNIIKLSLGLGKMAYQSLSAEGGDGRPVVEVKEDPPDLAVEAVWQSMANMSTEDLYL